MKNAILPDLRLIATQPLALLVSQEQLVREQRRQSRLLQKARLRLEATVHDIDYQPARNLERSRIAQLSQNEWIAKGQNLLITGPCGSQRNDLLELVDDRYGRTSTVVISQLPTDEWYGSVGDNTLADAILDRLMHNAHRLDMKGESMRKRLAQVDQSEQKR